jgi:hypothetical protein
MATNVLQHVKIDPEFSLGYSLHAAMTRHGKSPWSQMREIWRLRYGPGKLRADEYYYYGLYDDRRFSLPTRRASSADRSRTGSSASATSPNGGSSRTTSW